MKDAELARLLRYYWNDKGDIERCTAFSRADVEHRFPKVLQAWDEVQLAQRNLSAELDKAVEQAQAQEHEDDL
jgi:hypothetical protein